MRNLFPSLPLGPPCLCLSINVEGRQEEAGKVCEVRH